MLNSIDKKLIRLLNENSWEKLKILSEELNVSRMTIQKRINGLIQNGVILKYTILVNPNLYSKKIFYEIKTNPKEPDVLNSLKKLNFETLEGIIGDYSLIIKQNFLNNQQFNENLEEIDKIQMETYRLIEIFKTYKEHGQVFEEKDEKIKKITDIEARIVKLLHDQGKEKFNTIKLSKKINLSQPSIYKKIKELKHWNIIKKFTISINPHFLDYKVKFYMRIKVDLGRHKEVALKLRNYPEIIDLYRTGENYSIFSTIISKNIEDFNEFINRLYEENPIIDTKTILVVNSMHQNYLFPSTLI
ncbi:MAG: Lrp/AsnC ligand binding domain-containing protein [Candidatus Helarchaeota archaeon]